MTQSSTVLLVRIRPAWLLLLALLSAPACAVRLPAVLSDHMVLQRGTAVPIWGWADPGETITVGFAGQVRAVRAGADGRWRVNLDLSRADGRGTELQVKGSSQELRVHDVLVGEVWLAAGQSNMEKPLGEKRGQKPTFGAAEEIAAADHPQIRLFKVAQKRAAQPADDVAGKWVVCSPATIDAIKFSAVAYFFGRRLQSELGRPVGLVQAAVGGTRIEPWTPSALKAATPSGATGTAQQARTDDGDTAPPNAALFNGMVAPLAPFALAGVIWYQGESNVVSAEDMASYTAKMAALVDGWRRSWQTQMPFYYVQIAPHLYHVVRRARVPNPETASLLREAQADALRIPGTGMIVTTDLADDLEDIHPRDKKSVGVRLANLALAKTYRRSDLPFSGPVVRRVAFEGARAVIEFDHGKGLSGRDSQEPVGFEIAGADGRYLPAQAVVAGERAIVGNPEVRHPVAVRYGWLDTGRPNVVNGAGLPARPFRSPRPE